MIGIRAVKSSLTCGRVHDSNAEKLGVAVSIPSGLCFFLFCTFPRNTVGHAGNQTRNTLTNRGYGRSG